MKKQLFLAVIFLFSVQANIFAWGQTGHRVVGEIAWQHLTKKAKKNVQRILQDESLAMCSNYMDFIKSDSHYDSLGPWHYCTIPDGESYAGPPKEGDVIMAIEKYTHELETGIYSVSEAFALKCLVHLVGDIHQPLHVGNGTDRGGNSVKVEFFYEKSNLHRVWDSELIDHQQLSYTDYTNWVTSWAVSKNVDTIVSWYDKSVLQWADESMAMRPLVYNIPADGKLGYQYNYDCIAALNRRLLQAGLRLAEVLNKIYA